jgi:hypothetical protein
LRNLWGGVWLAGTGGGSAGKLNALSRSMADTKSAIARGGILIIRCVAIVVFFIAFVCVLIYCSA